MKPTKHIKQLAEKLTKEDLKEHLNFYNEHIPHAYEKENTEERKKQFFNSTYKERLTQLNDIKKALYNGSFYMRVVSVSKSGMSRRIQFAYVKNNKIISVNDEKILNLSGCSKDGRVNGCGMDMLFHSQYTLFINLHKSYKKANYTKNLKQYLNY
jgi:hypothetical protein